MGHKNTKELGNDKLKRIRKHIESLDIASLEGDVRDANLLSSVYLKEGRRLVFEVDTRTVQGQGKRWKQRIIISARKEVPPNDPSLPPAYDSVQEAKSLNIKAFYTFYFRLQGLPPPEEVEPSSDEHDDLMYDLMHALDEVPDECCICMDRRSTIILPACAHAYCDDCFAQWSTTQTATNDAAGEGESVTCPLCRAEVGDEDELWVLAETPSSAEVADYVHDIVDSLPGS